MAEPIYSTKVVGTQWNYTTFLYRGKARIQDLENTGSYYQALRVLIDLIDACPKEIQEMFEKRIGHINRALSVLREQIREKAIDHFNFLGIIEKKENELAALVVKPLLQDLSKELDRRGYMEKTAPTVPEGYSHTYERHKR